jgi:signal transduction histidine kinase
MANEALSNALRHSDATSINVLAVQSAHVFQITISDDGKGFDLHTLSNHNGLGLRNIQQRATLHGGHVQIETALGQGTRLIISVPIKK